MLYKPAILFADKDQKFATYFTILLGRMGFDVVSVSNGADVVNLAKAFNFDLIITEVELRDMDGFAVLNLLKRNQKLRTVPVIIFTAVSEAGTQRKLKTGAYNYITKPIDVLSLYKTLQNCIADSQGYKREYLRVDTTEGILLSYDGATKHCTATTISEGGLYIRGKKTLPAGTEVAVTLPIKTKETIALKGTVLYSTEIRTPGTAIVLKKVPKKYAVRLRAHILNLLLKDIEDEIRNEITAAS